MPIIRVHVVAVVCIGLGLFFDTYDVFLSGTLSVVLKKEFHLGADTLKAVLASGFVGQFLGALLLGRIADRLGRRRAFLVNLAAYSIFTLIGGLSPNVTVLVLSRFLAGMGLGAELALADTYLSDLLPAKVRGRFIAVAYTLGLLGVPAAGFLARWLVPLSPFGVHGWRWMFFAGAVGAVLIWALRWALPESPRWLESVGRTAEADAITSGWEQMARDRGRPLPEPEPITVAPPHHVPVRILFSAGYARRTVMAWVMNVGSAFGYYGFGTIATLVLVAKGYSVVGSLTYLSLTYIGYPIGSVLSLFVIERVERKLLIATTATGMAVAGLLFGYAGSPAAVVGWGFAFTVVSNIYSNAFHIYLPEVYPTAIRATGAGAAYSVSRLTTAALPYILIPALSVGTGFVFVIVAIALAVLVVDVLLLGPPTTGRSLEATAPVRAAPATEPLPVEHR
ncbi:MFS transporter [Nocardia sp. alder85J]|uniref:MFS transporter n=1 Tax=Nocardia sp. alder85J TaxID=2862949 RepID=UPI001CD2AFEC|nr:MFS transporter [Nocardia sp. alder85J]MCX4094102.1 MFS transporter [Nocardia sp. alder85J]